jgi:soluble lytic murein transglycosylase-like protein
MLIQTCIMNMSNAILIIKIFTFLFLISSANAKADIYVDLSKSDVINIANFSDDQNYTFKIEEPVLPIANQKIAVINKNGSEDNQYLPFNNEVIIAANMTGIEPALIHAVIAVESKHNPRAQSIKGAYGLMQLMPETSRRFNVLDKNNPKQNIVAGAQYLKELLKLFNGDIKLTLAAYNAGPAAVQRFGGKIPPYKETVNYVPKVLKYYKQYS